MATRITMIPPTRSINSAIPLNTHTIRRVCGYARVSTDLEEQLTSYEAQVEYYPKFISEHDDWKYVGMYTDEGITGTSIKRRPGFQKMIADALDGKIDLIVTKSISRFARNVVDSISTVRTLKEHGVEVFFEKDGLWTFDPASELTITILSSIAQEESRNLSQNVTWGQRKRFANGKVTMPYKQFLGYDKGEDGSPVINEEQAKVVRRIYRMCVEGLTPSLIAKRLTAERIPTPSGKEKWQSGVVESILTNEKYKGDALLQKTYCTDFLTKKIKVNEGEVPQYYVESSHPAIIDTELFDYVQNELARRKGMRITDTASAFSGHIFCGDCGSVYGCKVWHSTSKYRRVVWRCNGKYEKGEKICSTPHFYEEQLKAMFVDVMNTRIQDRSNIISAYSDVIKMLTDNTELQAEAEKLQTACDGLLEQLRSMVRENANAAQDQEEYQRRYSAVAGEFKDTQAKLDEVQNTIEQRSVKRTELKRFVKVLKERGSLLTEFDAKLWAAVIDRVIVRSASEVVFRFKDGSETAWKKAA